MEDDDEVLLENDPLAIYLKNQQLVDFETTKIHIEDDQNIILDLKSEHKKFYPYEIGNLQVKNSLIFQEYQIYFENILKSELLLEEDYNILETYYSNNLVPVQDKFIHKITLCSSFSLLGGVIYKCCNLKFLKAITPLCSVPLAINLYYFIKRKVKNRKVTLLLQALNKLTHLNKKCLKLVGEYSAIIGFYSSASTINTSSLNNVYIRFAKQFYALLLSIIKLLAFNSSQIILIAPLTIENNFKYGMKEDLFLKDEINLADLKLLFELYLLVQSDFIKTLGLSFCSYLWANPNCDINKLLAENIPTLVLTLNEKIILLEKEYYVLRNYGAYSKNSSVRTPRKFNNSPSNYMNSCLHNAEMHFQQLLSKSKDLQSIIDETELDKQNEKTEIIKTMLNEMEKQMISSKNTLEAVTKYFNQLQNKTIEPENKVTMPQPTTVKTVESQEEELSKKEQLTYELYIPKEGLDFSELEVDTQRPVFSVKDLDYSGVLLQELRTILKNRNPDVFEENTRKPEINSDSESEDEFYNSYKRRNIFRPTEQPIGLAENLQTINHVLAARKNILQYEEICGDSSDDAEDAVTN